MYSIIVSIYKNYLYKTIINRFDRKFANFITYKHDDAIGGQLATSGVLVSETWCTAFSYFSNICIVTSTKTKVK